MEIEADESVSRLDWGVIRLEKNRYAEDLLTAGTYSKWGTNPVGWRWYELRHLPARDLDAFLQNGHITRPNAHANGQAVAAEWGGNSFEIGGGTHHKVLYQGVRWQPVVDRTVRRLIRRGYLVVWYRGADAEQGLFHPEWSPGGTAIPGVGRRRGARMTVPEKLFRRAIRLRVGPAWPQSLARHVVETLALGGHTVREVELWVRTGRRELFKARSSYFVEAESSDVVRRCADGASEFIEQNAQEPAALFRLVWLDR